MKCIKRPKGRGNGHALTRTIFSPGTGGIHLGDQEQKTKLLNEARKRTRLNRKVLIDKLAHPPKPEPGKRGPRKATYGAEVKTALVKA